MKTTFFALFLAFGLLGCSTDDKRTDTAESAFKYAEEFDKEDRYEEAIKRYGDVRNRFPYSKYATQAELAMADVFYRQESYAEAQVSYQSFKDLHPKHPQIDYVTFQLAMSYFQQLPGTVDRDLTLAASAILFFDEVIQQYPNSKYFGEAKKKRDESYKMLAGKEDYIAEFYFIREKYDSALSRYEGLLKKYPNRGFDAKSLSRMTIAAHRLGEKERAKKYLNELAKRFPSSSELEEARKEIQ